MAYCPSLQGGNAIADILYGDYNPSDKVPLHILGIQESL
jgi:hypothetical protein